MSKKTTNHIYVIEDINEAIEVANQYSLAFELCVKEHLNSYISKKFIKMGSPVIVNGCLACEIYLKVLLYKQGKTREGHNVKRLFKLLKVSQRDNIIKYIGGDNANFINDLKSISKGFVNARYCYEKGKNVKIKLVFLSSLIKALKEETKMIDNV